MHVIRSCCPSSFKGVQPPFPRATFRGESDYREIRLCLFLPCLRPVRYFLPPFFSNSFFFFPLLLRPSSTPPSSPSNMDPVTCFRSFVLSRALPLSLCRSSIFSVVSSLVHESPRNQREAPSRPAVFAGSLADFGFWPLKGWKFRVQGLAAALCLALPHRVPRERISAPRRLRDRRDRRQCFFH